MLLNNRLSSSKDVRRRMHPVPGGPTLFARGHRPTQGSLPMTIQPKTVQKGEDADLCVCGHTPSAHRGACTVPGCSCRELSPSEDDDPDVDSDADGDD